MTADNTNSPDRYLEVSGNKLDDAAIGGVLKGLLPHRDLERRLGDLLEHFPSGICPHPDFDVHGDTISPCATTGLEGDRRGADIMTQ